MFLNLNKVEVNGNIAYLERLTDDIRRGAEHVGRFAFNCAANFI